jgi:hypothetical protein
VERERASSAQGLLLTFGVPKAVVLHTSVIEPKIALCQVTKTLAIGNGSTVSLISLSGDTSRVRIANMFYFTAKADVQRLSIFRKFLAYADTKNAWVLRFDVAGIKASSSVCHHPCLLPTCLLFFCC